ncbi:hypothetical protein Dimus_006370 [Dionaea muscipula]
MKNRVRTKVGKNWEKVVSKSTDPPVVAPKSNPKRKRGEKETLSSDDKAISFSFSEEASLYSDPGSLLDSFDGFLFPNDIKCFEELGTNGVNDQLLQDALKVTRSILYIRQQCSSQVVKMTDIRAENQTLRAAKKKFKEELRCSKEEVGQLKLECEKYKFDCEEMLQQIKDVAAEAVVKTRGNLRKEFKEDQTGE